MNKKELIDAVAEKLGATKVATTSTVEAVFEVIVESILKDEEVKISQFGAFQVVEKKERKGRNPKTGEEITIPAKKAMKFKPSSVIREKLKG